jgi:DUF1365 family protein
VEQSDSEISNAPAWLYYGDVMHARMAPKKHRFQYKVFSLLIDIDQLSAAKKMSPVFSIDKFNLLSFHQSDHLPKDRDISIREHVADCLLKEDITWQASQILLGCYPRILGKVFNPLSVFYVYGPDQKIGAVIYEVRNTFGEKHIYTRKIETENLTSAHIKQEADKMFYVSPFMDMDMRYFFTMSEPKETMSWRILEKQNGQPILAATYFGRKNTLKTSNLLKFFLQIPLLTWKILVGIHFEALRLWLKGLQVVPRTNPKKNSA